MNDFKKRIQDLAKEYQVPTWTIYTSLAGIALVSILVLAALVHSPTKQELQVAHQAVFNQPTPQAAAEPDHKPTAAQQWEEQNRRDRDAGLAKHF